MKENIKELTLLLMYLTSWKEEFSHYDKDGNIIKNTINSTWKGYSFDAMNKLVDEGYLHPSKNKSKSTTLTKDGVDYAKKLMDKYLK